LFKQIN